MSVRRTQTSAGGAKERMGQEELDIIETDRITSRNGFETSLEMFRVVGEGGLMTRIIERDVEGDQDDIELVLYPHEAVELMHAIAAMFGYTIDDGEGIDPDTDEFDIDDAQEF